MSYYFKCEGWQVNQKGDKAKEVRSTVAVQKTWQFFIDFYCELNVCCSVAHLRLKAASVLKEDSK